MKRDLITYAALFAVVALAQVLSGCLASQIVTQRGKSWSGGSSTGSPVLIVAGRGEDRR